MSAAPGPAARCYDRAAPHPLLNLLPQGVSGHATSVLRDEACLTRGEEAYVATASPQRRREFATGRYCSRRAMAVLGEPVHELPARQDRAPDWPPHLRGSISHSHGLVAAAVGHAARFSALGLDVERRFAVAEDLAQTVVRQDEAQVVAKLSHELGQCTALTLVFSLKEAAFKCAYTLDGRIRGFHDFRVGWRTSRTAVIAVNSGEGPRMASNFGWDDSHVFALAWIENKRWLS